MTLLSFVLYIVLQTCINLMIINLCNDYNVILGGFDGHRSLQSCEVYDIDKNEWTMIADMLHNRSGHGCITFKDCIYVIGGFDGQIRLKLCEKYNLSTNTWSMIREMNIERTNFGVAVIDDVIFVAGGYGNFYTTNTSEYYVPNENQWFAFY